MLTRLNKDKAEQIHKAMYLHQAVIETQFDMNDPRLMYLIAGFNIATSMVDARSNLDVNGKPKKAAMIRVEQEEKDFRQELEKEIQAEQKKRGDQKDIKENSEINSIASVKKDFETFLRMAKADDVLTYQEALSRYLESQKSNHPN